MENNPKISIIVPVYNTEHYLKTCIESLLNQTYSNLEIILIDDGSKDLSGKICDDYANRDSRIKVLHQDNAGQAAARNRGLDIATGEYIGFVDSDDSCNIYMYEHMLSYLRINRLDIVVCGRMAVKDGVKEPFFYYNENRIVDTYEARKLVLTDKIGSQPCEKLFKSHLWKNIRFPENRIYEDLATTYLCFFATDSACGFLHEPLYNYCLRQDSTSFKRNYKQIFGIFSAFEERAYFAEANEPSCAELCIAKAAKSALGVLNTYKTNDIKDNLDTVEHAKLFLKKYRKQIIKNQNISLSRKLAFGFYYYFNPIYNIVLKFKKMI